MLSWILRLLSAFKKGNEVDNPAAVKSAQIAVNGAATMAVGAAAIARASGVNLPIDDATIMDAAGGLVSVINIMATMVSSKKVGV